MPNALATFLREQKLAIAEQLAAAAPANGTNADERLAMALARIDGLVGMAQQPPERQQQTLQELVRSQVKSAEDVTPALNDMQETTAAAFAALQRSNLPTSEALAAAATLNELSVNFQSQLSAYLQQWVSNQVQESVRQQRILRAAMEELSSPIIPLYSGILTLPLVGTVDTNRAQNVTEQLLEAIAREQADLVLLDVTGISTLDTSVANHIVQTARAASLLGSQVILVGISAEIAQTLVMLGVDLGNLITLGDLQSGLEYALAQLGMAIRPLK